MTLKPARLLVLLLATAAVPVMAQNVATVNGKPIPTARLDMLVKDVEARGQKDSPELREKVKEQLIDFEILSQEAEKLGLGKSDDVKERIAYVREQILINALVQDHLKKFPVKDADVKAEYDKFKAQAAGQNEYHARHILVDTEDEAKAIITKLKGGAKFEDLAKEKSKDTGSATNGGDLDWTNPNGPNGFVKPFSDALVALKKGQFTETPVKTKFGYHVIKLEDVRPVKVPAFDEVKPNITQKLQQEELENYRNSLKAKAKIQ